MVLGVITGAAGFIAPNSDAAGRQQTLYRERRRTDAVEGTAAVDRRCRGNGGGQTRCRERRRTDAVEGTVVDRRCRGNGGGQTL